LRQRLGKPPTNEGPIQLERRLAHNAHAGEFPSLLVNADGRATLAATTDRFSMPPSSQTAR